MTSNLDQALSDLTTLRDELSEIAANRRLTYGVGSLVARAVDHVENAHEFIERAIATDDAAHPTEV